MIPLFMMGVGLNEFILLMLPISIAVFIGSKIFFKRRFKATVNTKIVAWSLLATVILSPLIFIGLVALIFFTFSFYESLN